MNLHGKIIVYRNSESLDVIPKRNADLPSEIDNNDVLFMPNCVKVIHEKNTDEKYSSFKVIMFGVLLNGIKTAVILEGFKPLEKHHSFQPVSYTHLTLPTNREV